MARLVRRFGRLETAALLSLVWALPMSAWAGSVDLAPGPLPWTALALGFLLLAGWLALLPLIARLPQPERPVRYRISSMTRAERGWNLLLATSTILLVGWLNGAATVDWGILGRRLAGGQPAAVALAGLLVLLLLAFGSGTLISWRQAACAYRARPGTGLTPP